MVKSLVGRFRSSAVTAVTALDLNRPTNDFTTGPAMDPDEVIHAMNAGAGALSDDCDYLVVGEMGIGNTTSAAAISMGPC